MTASGPWGPLRRGARVPFKGHLVAFFVASVLLVAAEWLLGADWPLFWPLMIWVGLLALHYFLSSALDPDESWIEERTADLRARSYDFEHIRDIEKRIGEGDRSVTPRAGSDASKAKD